MACGTPVIASDVGGLGFLVQDGETGYTVPDGEPDKLCEKLTLLLGDYKLRQKMGLRAAEVAQSYDWENIARQIVDIYKSLIRVKEGQVSNPTP
jgi:D-inositol-3-phosphate glycosyltransferase